MLDLTSFNMGKILVIEDEKNIRDTLAEILVLNGYDVECAFNGRNGITKAIEMKPDLVLCDVMMPELDGWQTVKEFRLNPGLYCTPFVFMSALSTMQDFRTGMNLGADDYLAKPFDIKELLQIVAYQLNKVEIRKRTNNIDKNKNTKEALNDFKEKIKEKTKDFFDSLERAKMVQKVILPSDAEMKELFPEHFIFYSPKDTISGDFYWSRNVDGIKLVAVADCTGHGIPAALISMVCYNLLNTSVDQYGYRNPAEILTKVNDLLVEFMSAHHKNYIGDGMDISLCAILPSREGAGGVLQYAGAKRPIYIHTKKFNSLHIQEDNLRCYENLEGQLLYEIKGSNSSIGGIGSNFEIQEQAFEFQHGDTIYLTSDGFADQFGGNNDKKYKTKNLKNLILSFQTNEMAEQKQLLQKEFENWKKELEQTDDVTVIGIRL
jgi:CheY-like chemotaxis protein